MVLFVVMPIAAGTILGWAAVARIHRSKGELYGLPLALYAGLLFPLLVLDGLIVFLIWQIASVIGPITPLEVLLLGLPLSAAVDFWIVRMIWRSLTKSPREKRTKVTGANEPAAAPLQEARLSRTAVIGACWPLLIFLLPVVLQASLSLWVKGLVMSLGPTLLGWIAILQIRRSAGRLDGLGLALFDVLLFPLLALDIGIWLLVGNAWRSNPPEVGHPVGALLVENEFLVPLFALTLCAVVDLLIVLWAWRMVRKPIGVPITGAGLPTPPPTEEGRAEGGNRKPEAEGPATHPVKPASSSRRASVLRGVLIGTWGMLVLIGILPLEAPPWQKVLLALFISAGVAVVFVIGAWFAAKQRSDDHGSEAVIGTKSPAKGGAASAFRADHNPWEPVSLIAGTVVFVSILAFAWEWDGPFRMLLLILGVFGLWICALSFAGYWPFRSPLFTEPNFSSRNLRRRWAPVMMGVKLTVIFAAGIGLILEAHRTADNTPERNAVVGAPSKKSSDGPARTMRTTPEEAAREPYVGEWEWREGGGSDDFCILILKDDGTAVVMEDGEDGKAGKWALADDGITMTMEDDTIASFLDPDGHLVLGKNRGAPRFTKVDSPEKVLREYTEAGFSGDVERAYGMIGPPLTDTWDEVAKALIHLQLREKNGTRPLELVEWHREGEYAVARYENPPELKTSGYVILERAGTTWRVVWVSGSWIETTFADYLDAFRRFRLVDRGDAGKVAGAFITAVRNGAPNLAMMLSGFPLSGNPGKIGEVFPGGGRKASESEPASLLDWHEEGPYAVTPAKLQADKPDLETSLGLRKTGRVWQVVWAAASGSPASLAEDMDRFMSDPLLARVLVEDLALHFLVAIREQDESVLRELCVDRIQGWTDEMIGHFSMGSRESFREKTGKEFAMHPDSVWVEGDLAVVTCRAFREVQKKLGRNIMVLHFCRTESGWRVWTARMARASLSIEEHLGEARKRSAEWKNQGPDTNGGDGRSSRPYLNR